MKQTYIYVDNFRGFSGALIPLRQVNFLVGENSTGKTSFLELLNTLTEMAFWAFEPKFASGDHEPKHFLDLVSASSSSKKQFTIGALQVSDESNETFGSVVSFVAQDGRPSPSRVSIIADESVSTLDGPLWKVGKNATHRYRIRACSKKIGVSFLERAQQFVRCHRAATGFGDIADADKRLPGPLYVRYHDLLFREFDSFENRKFRAPFPLMGRLVELAPIRSKPRRTYDAPQTEFSPEGDHTPYVIRKRLANEAQAETFLRFIEAAGSSSGLFRSVKLKQYGKGPLAPFELQVVLGNATLGIENVGYGVSQALPVLVEMFTRPKKTAFTIQQPEVHLHPRAQATFGDLAAELARADEKRFFIETHSDFAIDRFRLNVRTNGPIDSQLLFFRRSQSRNEVHPIPIDASGRLSEDQPPEYRDFFLNESLAILA